MADRADVFLSESRANAALMAGDAKAVQAGFDFVSTTAPHKYAYNFTWMGRPIIQFPQDMLAMQEIIWELKPDLIVETGIAHGGSVLYYASILELIGHGEVIGIDVDVRKSNREAIEAHPMNKRLRMIEGSSVDVSTIEQVQAAARGKRAIVVLDSNHSHEHVLAELAAYAPLVCLGGYCVVMDTVIEDMPSYLYENGDRPWGRGNSPKTAVSEFLSIHTEFEVDISIQQRLLITVAPGGYLRRVG